MMSMGFVLFIGWGCLGAYSIHMVLVLGFGVVGVVVMIWTDFGCGFVGVNAVRVVVLFRSLALSSGQVWVAAVVLWLVLVGIGVCVVSGFGCVGVS